MGINIAISIGVARAGSLPELPGAVAGARNFIEWACAAEPFHKYECYLITDELEPVTVERISKTIAKALDEEVARLLLFFSGHGVGTATTDFWLLSGWEENSDEAVNLNLSFNNAKRWPIGQVAVFADACRSTIPQAALIGGRSIFPRSRVTPRVQPQWDHFLATRLGDIAQEVANSDPTKAYGVFSQCLLDALHGRVPAVLENRPPPVVTSQALASYLEEAVPLASGKIPGAAVQYPDVVPSWRRPKDFYFGVVQPNAPTGDRSLERAALHLDADGIVYSLHPDGLIGIRARSVPHGFGGLRPPTEADEARRAVTERRRQIKQAIDTTAARYASAGGRETFETRQGLTVMGGRVHELVVSGGAAELLVEDGTYHVRGHGLGPQTAALRLDGDRWAAALILPDFVGVLHVEDGLVQGLNYVPARYGRFDVAWHEPNEEQIRKEADLVFRWAAMMNQELPPERRGLRRTAHDLRMGKHRNPALGIAAAYSFERAGSWRWTNRLVDYFGEAHQEVPFDIALLSTRPRHRDRPGHVRFEEARLPPIAGTFPLLRHGWALFDGDDPSISPAIERLRRGVLPALWTTFDRNVGQEFAQLIDSGEL